MPEIVAGHLEVGTDGAGNVVMNHPKLLIDENGAGHIVFSPQQACALAHSLNAKAAEAELERFKILSIGCQTGRVQCAEPNPPRRRELRTMDTFPWGREDEVYVYSHHFQDGASWIERVNAHPRMAPHHAQACGWLWCNEADE